MIPSGNWSRGYPTGSMYPPAWHSFQSPAHLRAVCAVNGIAWDVDPGKPMAIAEIGCGTGYTACLLAAGLPEATVVGIDYNPAHIAEARSLADAAGLRNVLFLELDLASTDEGRAEGLPEFDLITAHGVWSWVGDEVREGIVHLIRTRLKAGGLALISYNALPGAARGYAMWSVFKAVAQDASSPAEVLAAARGLARALQSSEASHLITSAWSELVLNESLSARDTYLIHEFGTSHWRPAAFADVSDALAKAGCDYAGSATLDENFPTISLTPAQQEVVSSARGIRARETLFDLCVQRAFRRDLFVRGMRPRPRDMVVDAIKLIQTSEDSAPAELRTQAGTATLPDATMSAVREALSSGPKSIAALRELPGCGTTTPSELLVMLLGSGRALPLWREADASAEWAAAVAAARRLNVASAQRYAPHGAGQGSFGLASPMIGGAVNAGPLELAVAACLSTSGAIQTGAPGVRAVIDQILPPGPRPGEEVEAELVCAVTTILENRAPVWERLGLV
jgi:predicted O-methyltransferase YrrM